MEVDHEKPLISKFELIRRIRRIEYEGIHLVCFGYGKYGHKKEGCPSERQHEHKEPEMESVATIRRDDIENGKSKKYGNRDTN